MLSNQGRRLPLGPPPRLLPPGASSLRLSPRRIPLVSVGGGGSARGSLPLRVRVHPIIEPLGNILTGSPWIFQIFTIFPSISTSAGCTSDPGGLRSVYPLHCLFSRFLPPKYSPRLFFSTILLFTPYHLITSSLAHQGIEQDIVPHKAWRGRATTLLEPVF